MTPDELKNQIESGTLIECKNVCQRAEAIQLLIDIGFKLHPSTDDWLRCHPDSTQFLHPGLDEASKFLTIWSTIFNKDVIQFADIVELIVQGDTPIDERGDEEFFEAFAKLMG